MTSKNAFTHSEMHLSGAALSLGENHYPVCRETNPGIPRDKWEKLSKIPKLLHIYKHPQPRSTSVRYEPQRNSRTGAHGDRIRIFIPALKVIVSIWKLISRKMDKKFLLYLYNRIQELYWLNFIYMYQHGYFSKT